MPTPTQPSPVLSPFRGPFDVQPCAGGGIDPDITLVDGVYYMFYCPKGRIVQATCSSLTGIYNE